MMVAVPITETVKIKRMTEFAAEVTRLADQRPTSTSACWSMTCTPT